MTNFGSIKKVCFQQKQNPGLSPVVLDGCARRTTQLCPCIPAVPGEKYGSRLRVREGRRVSSKTQNIILKEKLKILLIVKLPGEPPDPAEPRLQAKLSKPLREASSCGRRDTHASSSLFKSSYYSI